jgi:hypothetical protein
VPQVPHSARQIDLDYTRSGVCVPAGKQNFLNRVCSSQKDPASVPVLLHLLSSFLETLRAVC